MLKHVRWIVNQLTTAMRVEILKDLCSRTSMRDAADNNDVSRQTVINFAVAIGRACAAYQDEVFRNLTCKRIQTDESWNFCYGRTKHISIRLRRLGYGSVWTWFAINADTKLIICWRVGPRDTATGIIFMQDLASRLKVRPQLTTDSGVANEDIVEAAFGTEVDYARVVKSFYKTFDKTGPKREGARYEAPPLRYQKTVIVSGNPDPDHISTNYAERQINTMRQKNARYTRLSLAFSKSLENHALSTATSYMAYNFVRKHGTLRCPPARAAGITDHKWKWREIVALLDDPRYGPAEISPRWPSRQKKSAKS